MRQPNFRSSGLENSFQYMRIVRDASKNTFHSRHLKKKDIVCPSTKIILECSNDSRNEEKINDSLNI